MGSCEAAAGATRRLGGPSAGGVGGVGGGVWANAAEVSASPRAVIRMEAGIFIDDTSARSKASGVPFIEIDREIEAESGLPLAELFSLYGQAGYRRFEGRCLERVVKEHPRAVLSVGGGVVSEGGTYDFLLANCFTVWLKARPEEHMQRVIAQGDMRPMAESREAMDDLKRILAGRGIYFLRSRIFPLNLRRRRSFRRAKIR